MTRKHAKSVIRVQSSTGEYSVVCASGSLVQLGVHVSALGEFSSVHIVSSERVWKALGRRLLAGLASRIRRDKSARPSVHLMDDRESHKTTATVEGLCRALVRAGADRKALVIAVGGGVVGDVAGYAAASYLRGVALMQVPTTLVAQVDSSVGGKTGVNLPEGKNLVGAFYPARLVVVDPEALTTLPEREYRGGLAEVIKYGVIADPELFQFLEQNMDVVLARHPVSLLKIIRTSIEIKAWVVGKDERESGLREILNFGHTFGHALESVTKYKKFQHGEAVAWGMMCAALLAHEVAGMSGDDVARIVGLIRKMGPLPGWPRVEPRTLLEAMRSDKKTRSGHLRFVLAPKIGTAKSYDGIPEKKVLSVLRFAEQLKERPEGMLAR